MMHKHIEKVKFHSAKAPIDIDDVNFDMLVTVQMHFFRYYFGRYSSKLAELVPLPYSRGRSTRHSDCKIFLSPFLDITRMSMQECTNFFLGV